MRLKKNLIFAASIALALVVFPVRSALAAPSNDKELEKVLHRLDIAAANFHTTSADFEFDSVTTEPLPDTDVQKGTIYYERKGAAFQMAAHIRELNGKPVPKIYAYAGGKLRLFEPMLNQVTTIAKAGKFESYLMLGFGASGKELAEKWNIRYLGTETLDKVKTDKLELIAKDPAVRKMIPKVTIWIDPERGVNLKQVFDEGPGSYRVSVYFNIKVNESLPGDAFTLKTNGQTQYVNH